MTRRTRSLCLLLGLLLAPARARSEETPAQGGPDAAREVVGKWIATQRVIYQERKDWQQQKEILRSRIELVRKESAELAAKLAETRKTAAEADGKKAQAASAKQQLVDESERLAGVVLEFETALRGIEPMLPPQVQEKVRPLFERVPEDPGNTRISVAERFQNVLGIMNEANRVSGEITLATEVRTLADGKPAEVKTVYLGLAQAYYLSTKGEAGVGRPTRDGWVFTPARELAERIREVVEILEGKARPKFVPLPVKIS